jgi:N6-L-threonylcarbamoyladenine synthase
MIFNFNKFINEELNNLCASIQHTFIKHLMKKLIAASMQTGIKEISLAGGVSANTGLRFALENEGKKRGWNTYIPAFEYCTDNAGMIAITAYYQYLAGQFSSLDASPSARAVWA